MLVKLPSIFHTLNSEIQLASCILYQHLIIALKDTAYYADFLKYAIVILFTPRKFPFFLAYFIFLLYAKVMVLNANQLILGQIQTNYFQVISLAFCVSDI